MCTILNGVVYVYTKGTSTNRSVCGTYATVPWYANDLAGRALIGFKQYQRQDLIGGRYGLLGIPHDGEVSCIVICNLAISLSFSLSLSISFFLPDPHLQIVFGFLFPPFIF